MVRLLVFFVFSRRRNIPFVHGTPADLKDKKANQPTVPDVQADQDASFYVVLFQLAFNGEVLECIGHVRLPACLLACVPVCLPGRLAGWQMAVRLSACLPACLTTPSVHTYNQMDVCVCMCM